MGASQAQTQQLLQGLKRSFKKRSEVPNKGPKAKASINSVRTPIETRIEISSCKDQGSTFLLGDACV